MEARKFLKKSLPKADGLQTFKVANALNFRSERKYDVVTAMGLLEYFVNDAAFFERIRKLLDRRGLALVECRNRLFNITSGNDYTLNAAASGDLRDLIRQLDGIERYSPTHLKDSWKIQEMVFKKASVLLRGQRDRKATAAQSPRFHGRRRQHTPEELESVVRGVGLKLKYVVYYHVHPYLPRYERQFPVAFNRTAVAMQPLGYTSLGSTVCSAFIAVIEK
jgi:cyclopropane fatty-acyl-phospholipid synthase-like methyltransferase